MYTKGFFIGRTPPGTAFECQVATNGPRLWISEFPMGPGAVSCAGSTTTSLSNGSGGDGPTGSRGSGQSLQLADARAQGDLDTMTGAEDTDRHEGVVVGLVLLAAAFMAGGFAGFLLALLLR